MTPPNNRYDKLSELDDVESGPVFGEETWVQAPDGSWIRSTDKAARKLTRKAEKGGGSHGNTQPKAAPPPPPPPPPPPAPEPKRRLGRKAAEREREAEATRRAEQERRAELDRQAELERQRQVELDRQHQIELERKAELARQGRELERQAELERTRAAERQREAERERARVADLERQLERDRKRKSDADIPRNADLADTGTYWREPDGTMTHWPEDRPVSAPPLNPAPPKHGKPVAEPKAKSKAKAPKQPAPAPAPKARPAHVRHTGQRVFNGTMAVGLVLATLLLGAGINWLGPDPARAQKPFTESGATGQAIDARTFTVTVHTAKAAPAIQVGKAAVATQGAWVIVHISLTANHEPTHVGYAVLRDKAGRTFLATDRLAQPLLDGARTFQPGIGMQGDVVFEVPKDALTGLTILFAARPDQLGMDAVASVDLPPLAIADGQPPAALAPTEVKP